VAFIEYGDEADIRRLAKVVVPHHTWFGSDPGWETEGSAVYYLQFNPETVQELRRLVGTTETVLTSPADYTFYRPNKIVFVAAPAATTRFTATFRTQADADMVTDANRKASAWVNGKLGNRYAVPFALDGNSEYPPLIVEAANNYAAHLLRNRVGVEREQGMDQSPPDEQSDPVDRLRRRAEIIIKDLLTRTPLADSEGDIVAAADGPFTPQRADNPTSDLYLQYPRDEDSEDGK